MVKRYQDALRRLWDGLCDVYVLETAVNKANGRDEPTEVQKLHGEPCRLSFSSISSTTEQDSAPLIQQWLCLLGVPALIAAIFKYLHSLVKKNALDTAAVKAGLQALLRSQMISDYNKWEERGFAPIYARENFENCWKQYHSLGVNGVMDDLHNKFLELPVSPPDES